MKATDYAEAVGGLRVLEKKILTSSMIERVIDTPNASEALKLLSQNSTYDFSSLKRSEDYEEVLQAQLKAAYDLLYNISPSKDLIDILAARYDYHNIKVALKSLYLNQNTDYLYLNVSQMPVDVIRNAVFLEEMPETTPDHVVEAVQAGKEAFSQAQDPQMLDIAVDQAMFRQMLFLADQIESSYIQDYLRKSIDFYNIKTLMRVRNMQKGLRFLSDALVPGGLTEPRLFIENYDKSMDTLSGNFFYKYFGEMLKKSVDIYERSKNFSALEKLTDDFLLEIVKQSKYIAFGPEVLFAYLLARENEVRQIRIIMTCKINAIDSAVLRERLRDNYAR